ncbi:MAG: aldo/keto reductase [Bacteroidales bacterium]|jgi:predicted aldo/keto reductase-like oxidoreductase|nr:aldo/keto reductase [Bacteroidales bacterium]
MKQSRVNRRDFLRLSATGAGAFLLPNIAGAAVSTPTNKVTSEGEGIPVRPLGKTNVSLPVLSMGVMRADNPNVVRAAYSAGLFHFDTAHGYQNGRNEEMLGNFFADKPRDSFFIATKIKSHYPLHDNFEEDLNKRFAQSLMRLKMDYVDILYAHALGEISEASDTRITDALLKLKKEGKVRFIGFSTHAQKPEQIHAAIDAGIYDVILLSYNFKMNNLAETDAAIERAAKAGIGLIAMKSMAGGAEDAEGKKKINAQACLKWVWQNKHITTIIPGFSNFDEFDECLAAAHSLELTEFEKNYLADLSDKEMLFCRNCGTCASQCPEKLPIPDLMRAYMYAYGYRYAQLTKETLQELNISNACSTCTSCKVSCPSGFNVAQKIAAITPLTQVSSVFLT